MRTFGSLLLVVAAFALTHSKGYASASNATSQQANSASTPSAATDPEQTAPAGNSKAQNGDQKETFAPGVRRTGRRVPNTIRPYSRTMPMTGHYPPTVQANHENSKSEIGVNNGEAAKPIHGGTASHRTSPFVTRAGTGIGGQPVGYRRNQRTPPGAVGGPANAARNTGAINGSTMDRKHTN